VMADTDNGVTAQKAVKWKSNGCRHSFASYSFALSADAGRVAGDDEANQLLSRPRRKGFELPKI